MYRFSGLSQHFINTVVCLCVVSTELQFHCIIIIDEILTASTYLLYFWFKKKMAVRVS